MRGPEVRRARDTAPGAPEVAIEPARPLRLVPSRAVIVRPAVDPDGDKVTYRFEWLVDGVPIGVTGESFPGEKLRKGALLGVRVVASDGELEGPAALALARVADTPPGPLEIAIEPDEPHRGEPIRVKVTKPATDVDEDTVSSEFRWTVGGKTLNLPVAALELPTGLFAKHQKVKVEASASDGELAGPTASAEITVVNSPPSAATVVILPEAPRKGEPLRAGDHRRRTGRGPGPARLPVHVEEERTALHGRDRRGARGARVGSGPRRRFEVTLVASDGEVDGPPPPRP